MKTQKPIKQEQDKIELADMERRKDFAACAMIEADSMVRHWTRKKDEARALFNACLVQYILKKHSKVSVEQMVKDGFQPQMRPKV